MSFTSIPDKVRFHVWLFAGGRCQYPGCNEPLWKDTLTMRTMNKAYLAHIVADSPDGPRGDDVLSDQLKADPDNIMLLCDTHHRLIDKVAVDEHPAELLRQYKREHEERIERQTSVHNSKRTLIVMLSTRVGHRRADSIFSDEETQRAVYPVRYPATNRGFHIKLDNVPVTEKDSSFWELAKLTIDRDLAQLARGDDPTGRPINHLSIFAIAPIPILIYFGQQLSNITAADVYQRHRNPPTWEWQEFDNEGFDYRTIVPEEAESECVVAINISLSGPIHDSEITVALGKQTPTYLLTIAEPSVYYLKSQEQLELFTQEWRALLTKIRATHGEKCEVHVFPAVPNSVAVEMGRALLPKVDPPMHIYNRNAQTEVFRHVLTIE
ncbi:SAVED domain-containing protein [Hymenobacter sp. NST-14]|uniref:SAVED domain-containing protein n=1 Tax=Hymenobacter piscis TaxID=2839984 RepID=UPI001C0347BF|nr:SAVED domain-containing protein [Hymenobacter piscis]MBT9395054.1 SAVED domain-containing protein [Hymenobacter piscis]